MLHGVVNPPRIDGKDDLGAVELQVVWMVLVTRGLALGGVLGGSL